MENISFNPNNPKFLNRKFATDRFTAYNSSMPLRDQLGFGPGKYNPSAFGLGFFAAIAVPGKDITIDLRGHTLE